MKRPLFAATLTVALLLSVLRYELALQTRHLGAVHRPLVQRPLATPTVPPTPAYRPPAKPRSPHVHVSRRPAPATAAAAAAPVRTAAATTRPVARPTATATHRSPTPTPSPTGAVNGTFTGSQSSTPYGNVQVRITVTNGKITDVTALEMPSDNQRSRQISSQAGPQLRSEALAAQSANIDDVSGATYTSDGYKQSLQAAIDQANL